LDVICGPVAGGVEDHKHADPFEAARHELEEEVSAYVRACIRVFVDVAGHGGDNTFPLTRFKMT